MARDVSLCIPVYNQATLLDKTLATIQRQDSQRLLEVVVCDHGSTDDIHYVLNKYSVAGLPLKVVYRAREAGKLNAGLARNPTYRVARGDIVLINSADIQHCTEDAIDRMAQMGEDEFHVATVWGLDEGGVRRHQFTGEGKPPLCCLMSVWREDIFRIGGEDEDFILPAFDDYWLADRLQHGANVAPVFRPDVVAEHQWHSKDFQRQDINFQPAESLYKTKMKQAQRTGNWCSPEGPWPYTEIRA